MIELKSKKNNYKSLVIFSILFFAISIHAENFRTHSTKIISLENSFDKKNVQASINDSVVVKVPEDKTFIQGIEINIKVPKVVAEWRDSVAWSLYSSITPQPDEQFIDYKGIRNETGTFDTLSLNLLVPLEKNNNIKKDVYSHITDAIVDKENGFVFLRFQLIMKGVSDSLLNAKFSVSAKPILIDKGFLSLKPIAPTEKQIEPYSVFVDGKQVDNDIITKEGIITDTGDHNISIVSNSYRNEVRTVTVEQAKNTQVNFTFRDIKPIIRLVAPENTKIIFDGQEYKAPIEPFHTSQGDHTIKFIIGDYEIVRSLTVSNGRSYNVAINLEAQITEIEE